MLKKISYVCLSVAFVGTVKANTGKMDTCNTNPFSGFYAGLTFGQSISKNAYEARNQANVLNSRVGMMEDFEGGLLAGWGKEFGASRVYLGLEIAYFLIGGKTKIRDLAGNETTEIKRKDNLELACRLGFVLNRLLPYVKIGYASTKFQLDTLVPSAANVMDRPATISDRMNSFVMGTGVDFKLSQKLMAGIGYTYASHGKLSKRFSVDGGTTPISPAAYLGIQNKAHTHNMMLRLGYTF
ncbi:MAG: outer membrane protein [Alphaproteobacteria bacterium]